MFDFKAEAEEDPPSRSRWEWARVAAFSSVFLVIMAALTLAAMVVIGFGLIWFVRAVQD